MTYYQDIAFDQSIMIWFFAGAKPECRTRCFLQVYASFGDLIVCKLFLNKEIKILAGKLTNLEGLAPDAIKYKFLLF